MQRKKTVNVFMPNRRVRKEFHRRVSRKVSSQPELFTRFSALPPELRLMICKERLVQPQPIIVNLNSVVFYPYNAGQSGQYHHALCRVNHELSQECIKKVYSDNVFAFREHDGDVPVHRQVHHIKAFFEQIGQHNASLIRSIEIPFPAFYYPSFGLVHHRPQVGGADVTGLDTLLSFCTGLTTLTLKLSWRKMMSVGGMESEKFGDALYAVNERLRHPIVKFLERIVIDIDGDFGDFPNDDRDTSRLNFIQRMEDEGWIVVRKSLGLRLCLD